MRLARSSPRLLRTIAALAAMAALGWGFSACGNDDDPETTTVSGEILHDASTSESTQALAIGNQVVVRILELGVAEVDSVVAELAFLAQAIPADFELTADRALEAGSTYLLDATITAPNGDVLFLTEPEVEVTADDTSVDVVLVPAPGRPTIDTYPLLEVVVVDEVEGSVDAELVDDTGGRYVVSVGDGTGFDDPPFGVGDRVRIEGTYAESDPVQIFDVRTIIVASEE